MTAPRAPAPTVAGADQGRVRRRHQKTGDPRLARAMKRTREKKQLTQADLAREIGASRSWVAQVEAGNRAPSREHFKAWKAALCVDASGTVEGWSPHHGPIVRGSDTIIVTDRSTGNEIVRVPVE